MLRRHTVELMDNVFRTVACWSNLFVIKVFKFKRWCNCSKKPRIFWFNIFGIFGTKILSTKFFRALWNFKKQDYYIKTTHSYLAYNELFFGIEVGVHTDIINTPPCWCSKVVNSSDKMAV